ncbi:efflux RND transporter periplasmic adaptor subunit [Sulfitobacter sp. F26169L]|uniref:efflux RND transporter periplasmic adaptor subunit n=1 Tax=Sulfitobacter sp. F26169L TaxID=2996015 RepID=UPI002260B695|nr:efflux RND transporter periplasmic adaptor subunit [Sulfitobacter sp. F26169L]MCX7567894.1 efflux RND transporter periplasmic adaptor subunit [Sulfitobacter sp. F26169L]
MKALKQVAALLIVLAIGLYVWIAYVPAAHPLLQRTGLLDLLGIETAGEDSQGTAGERRGFGGGETQVVVAQVEEQAQTDRITAIGDGRAWRSVTVRSNATGLIEKLNLTGGETIDAGIVIAQLDDEAEQIALELAQIRLEDVQAETQRVGRLQGTGAVTEVRLREAEIALRNAELTLRKAEYDLSQRQITAPISGYVGLTDIQEGDRLASQEQLATITDRSRILIDFRVPERFIGAIERGQQIRIVPLGLRDVTLTGQIDAIDTVVDRASRTMLVRGVVENDQNLLRGGMAFSVRLSFPGETLLSIAPLAVQWSSDGPFVWAVREGKVIQMPVAIIQRNQDAVLVKSDDLVVGDTVVTEGVQTLRENAAVTIRQPEDDADVQTPAAQEEAL